MIAIRFRRWLACGCLALILDGSALKAPAQEIDQLEQFVLAVDQETALASFIPGSEEHYYYSCLWLQSRQRFADVDALLQRWIARFGATARVVEMQHRQALLTYDRNPQQALQYLRDKLHLDFAQQRRSSVVETDLPTSLDATLISPEQLSEQARTRHANLDGFEDAALGRLEPQTLSPEQRRSWLSRLTLPDVADLPRWIVEDLRREGSGGFGSLPIHRRLWRSQLDTCRRLYPELLNREAFVDAVVRRLSPNDAVDWQRNRPLHKQYLDRLWDFVQQLGPAHRSLQAGVLYRLLDWHRHGGSYPRAEFMAYLKTPRNSPLVDPQWLDAFKSGGADLNAEFPQLQLPPIAREDALIRDYLEHFLLAQDAYQEFAEYLRDDYVRRVFAETKLMHGLGEAAQWRELLTAEQLAQLQDRVELSFPADQSLEFPIEQAVSVDVLVKNVPTLVIKVYEINLEGFYRQNLKELTLGVDLDGLEPAAEYVYRYDEPAIRRHRRTFSFPDLNRRGAFVIDFLGNGQSSRMLIRKGGLALLTRSAPGGISAWVLDQDRNPVPGARLILGGREFTCDEQGGAALPYSTQPSPQPVILIHGELASLSQLQHEAEIYSLQAGFHVDRESLLAGGRASLLIRPMLYVNEQPVSLQAVREASLSISSFDRDGATSVKLIQELALHEARESVVDFLTPPRLATLQFQLTVTVWNQSLQQEQTLTARHGLTVNQIVATEHVDALHLARTEKGYQLEALGRNGEPRPRQAVSLRLKHRDYRDWVSTSLRTDKQGRVHLGNLPGIVDVIASLRDQVERRWTLVADQAVVASTIYRAVGEDLAIAYFGDRQAPAREEFALWELAGGAPAADRFEALKIRDGMVRLEGLPAGQYELVRKGEQPSIVSIRILEGVQRQGYLIQGSQAWERRGSAPLQIDQIQTDDQRVRFTVRNANRFTRVHVVAVRYQPRFSVFGDLSQVADAGPAMVALPSPGSAMFAGRSLGDELQYILDRRSARKFPGNMMERPSLLLQPFAVGQTETRRPDGPSGEGALDDSPTTLSAIVGQRQEMEPPEDQELADYACLDFLEGGSVVLANLEPDDQGVIELRREALGAHQQIRLVAVAPDHVVAREVALPLVAGGRRDLRLALGLKPDKAFAQRQNVAALQAGQTLEVADAASARLQMYGSLADVFRYFEAVSQNATLGEFRFVLDWPEKTAEEKHALYSKYACHELHFFLWNKDREFFDAVIRPYLANKHYKTFLDHWLLEEPLAEYREPWAYARLHTLERILLAMREEDLLEATRRNVRDQLLSAGVNQQALAPLFASALGLESLERKWLLAKPSAIDENASGGDKEQRLSRFAQLEGEAIVDAKNFDVEAGKKVWEEFGIDPSSVVDTSGVVNGVTRNPQRSNSLVLHGNSNDNFSSYFGIDRSKSVAILFRQTDQTQEWAENNYYHLLWSEQNADLAPVQALWRDYAERDPKQPFLSGGFLSTVGNFTEMMLALSVLDLPWKAEEVGPAIDAGRLTLQAKTPLLAVHQEVAALPAEHAPNPVLLGQHFFRRDDPYRVVDGKRVDKLVSEEFLTHVVYGCRVVATNPTSAAQALDVLTQVPLGAISVLGGKPTSSAMLMLEPYHTEKVEYFFYFPEPGDFSHYPAQASCEGQLAAAAAATTLHVVAEPSRDDRESWLWVSQDGSDQDVLQYLEARNLQSIDLSLLAFRLRDQNFYAQVMRRLQQRLRFDPTIWSYAVLHQDVRSIREYLPQATEFVNQCGLTLRSALLDIDPVQRGLHEHLEYRPLINARRHTLGKQRQILNDRSRAQYVQLLKVLAYQREIDDRQRLELTYYLLLQDRVEDAVRQFQMVDVSRLDARLQYDYCQAYLAFSLEQPATVRSLVQQYQKYPVERWRKAFVAMQRQLDEIDGQLPTAEDPDRATMAQLADSEPVLDFSIESDGIKVSYRNLAAIEVRYYVMDIEVLFSRDPFVQSSANRFGLVRPHHTQPFQLPADQATLVLQPPEELRQRNLLVEITGGGKTRSQLRLASRLNVQVMGSAGQILVRSAQPDAALAKVYVKAYARMKDGAMRFYKDGYTDLRGRFDYASLSTDELDHVERFALLVLAEEHGAQVKEIEPPKR